MSSPSVFSEDSLQAFRHLSERRDVNTVILHRQGAAGSLAVEVEANLTHEELLEALPADEPRLVVHELAFATPDGTRRNEQLLIFWDPVGAMGREQAYAAAFTALQTLLEASRVQLKVRQADELEYRKLAALASTAAEHRPGG
ncbi:cofilin family protein [Streptomyces sp. NPDC046876]|uniref:cofilin family protein n=1 Tax=Streptomyces sp. NPDC046876 TaxID=3155616 RepID=UPI0033E103CF